MHVIFFGQRQQWRTLVPHFKLRDPHFKTPSLKRRFHLSIPSTLFESKKILLQTPVSGGDQFFQPAWSLRSQMHALYFPTPMNLTKYIPSDQMIFSPIFFPQKKAPFDPRNTKTPCDPPRFAAGKSFSPKAVASIASDPNEPRQEKPPNSRPSTELWDPANVSMPRFLLRIPALVRLFHRDRAIPEYVHSDLSSLFWKGLSFPAICV